MDSISPTFGGASATLIASFTVQGEPASKARARFTNYGSKVRAYTPKKTKDAESKLAATYLQEVRRRETDTDKAFAMHAHFYNGTRQRRDIDNMVKLVLDGLNGAAWVDDNQVLEIAARKSFVTKAEARTTIQIFHIGDMEFPKKACLECGAKFRTYDSWDTPSGKKYCSRKCSDGRLRELRTRTCDHCGAEFTSEKSASTTKYCSRECRYAAQRAFTRCAICGREFSIQKCHVKQRNYCSDDCIREQDRRAQKDRRSKYFPGTCLVCGAGTTRKEYKRCNPCKRRGATGKPKDVDEVPTPKPRVECSEAGCAELARSRGMCGKHYTRDWRRRKNMPQEARNAA